ncbi:MAG: MoaD/ThiS family protein [Elusimicrobiota bacterium]
MIEIKLKFYSGLAEYIKNYKKEKELTIKLEKNESIRNIITKYIPVEKLKFIGLILVNKKFVNLDYIVQDGDKVSVLPLLNGG